MEAKWETRRDVRLGAETFKVGREGRAALQRSSQVPGHFCHTAPTSPSPGNRPPFSFEDPPITTTSGGGRGRRHCQVGLGPDLANQRPGP